MPIDYLAPSPFSPTPDAGAGAPVPPGPPMGGPVPGGPPPSPAGPGPGGPPLPIAALAALLHGPGGPPNGIPGAQGPGAPPYPMPQTPATMKYTNETQQDGTVLLRVQNPDGSPGPVVHIIKPPAAKAGSK